MAAAAARYRRFMGNSSRIGRGAARAEKEWVGAMIYLFGYNDPEYPRPVTENKKGSE
jgi:hypothetical protein